MDQIARRLALVGLHWRLGLQAAQAPQAQVVKGPGHGEEGRAQQPGDVTKVQPLMEELHGMLKAVRIERPPLGAVRTASFHQSGVTT